MSTRTHPNRCFDFRFTDVDTRILVEDLEDGVVIRASRDSFSKRRKQNFIRELATEGFIADCFQWSGAGVRWLVDASLARQRQDIRARADRFMLRLGAGAMLLWVALMVVAVLHGRQSP
jgi:hypothetical protein